MYSLKVISIMGTNTVSKYSMWVAGAEKLKKTCILYWEQNTINVLTEWINCIPTLLVTTSYEKWIHDILF